MLDKIFKRGMRKATPMAFDPVWDISRGTYGIAEKLKLKYPSITLCPYTKGNILAIPTYAGNILITGRKGSYVINTPVALEAIGIAGEATEETLSLALSFIDNLTNIKGEVPLTH